MAHQSEIDFVLPTEIGPRRYYIGDLLFQMVANYIFLVPFVIPAYVGIVISSGLNVVEAFALLQVLVATMGMTAMQALGLWRNRGDWRRTVVILGLFAALILPALHGAGYFPVGYSQLPYPSTAAAVLGEALIAHVQLSWSHLILFLAYGGVISLGYYASTEPYGFHRVRARMVVSFGQPSYQRQAIQQQKTIEGLGRLTKRLTLTTSGTPLLYFTRFHFIRLTRDGSLLMSVLFFAMFLAIGMGTEAGLIVPMSISAFLPTIFAFSWVILERDNTWTLVTSGMSGSHYFRALFLCFSGISIIIPVLTMAVGVIAGLSIPPTFGLAGVAFVLASSSTVVALLTRLNIPRTSLSLSGFALLIIPMLIGGLMAAPLFVLAILSEYSGTADARTVLLSGAIYVAIVAIVSFSVVGYMGRTARLEGL